MKNALAKIWVPMLLVVMAAVQSFGIDAGKSAGLRRLADSLSFNNLQDSSSIVIPDSLRHSEPLQTPAPRYDIDSLKVRYHLALKDSTSRADLRDSLINTGDTLLLTLLDSLYIQDSIAVAQAEYDAWYASLSR